MLFHEDVLLLGIAVSAGDSWSDLRRVLELMFNHDSIEHCMEMVKRWVAMVIACDAAY